jgi:hypothetical protein
MAWQKRKDKATSNAQAYMRQAYTTRIQASIATLGICRIDAMQELQLVAKQKRKDKETIPHAQQCVQS